MFKLGAITDAKAAREAAAFNELRKGGTVVVVDGYPSRWGALQRNPRVHMWDEDRLSSWPDLPANARLIMMGGRVGRRLTMPIERQAERRGVHIYRVARITDARALVEHALAEQPRLVKAKKEEQMTMIDVDAAQKAAEERKPDVPQFEFEALPSTDRRRGDLKAFVAAHADLAIPRMVAVEKLWPLVHARFPTTTKESVGNAIYTIKKERGLPTGRQGVSKKRGRVIFSAANVKPAPIVETSAQAAAKAGDDDVARLLVDAIASCQLALAELHKGEERVKAKVRQLLEDLK